MQAFLEHWQHAVGIHRVKVNTNKMIFMVEWDFKRWGITNTNVDVFFLERKAPYVTELYIANFLLS